MDETSAIEVIVPMLFSFWMVVVYVIFSIVMIAIWICVGILGGPAVRFKVRKPPKVPTFEEWKANNDRHTQFMRVMRQVPFLEGREACSCEVQSF